MMLIKTVSVPRFYRFLLLLFALVSSGCVTPPPPAVEASLAEPAGAVSLAQVRDAPRRYIDRPLRWSGSVVRTFDTPTGPRVEIVAKPADRNGRPLLDRPALGRFLLVAPAGAGPLPADYAITVLGRVRGTDLLQTPTLYYLAPVVTADELQLWHPARLPPSYSADHHHHGLRVVPRISVGIGYGRFHGWRGRYGVGFSIFP